MRDIVIYRDNANHQAPLGVILNKQSDGAHDDGHGLVRMSDPGALHNAEATRNSDIAASSVPITELPRELIEMNLDGQIVLVSISHDNDYAVAVAVVPHS
jgi:hypothetical protein